MSPGKSDVPLEQVKNMRAQGYDNNQIVESLQRDGYGSSQIFDALNQVDMAPANDLNPAAGPAMGQQESFPDYQEQIPNQGGSNYDETSNEELIEAIIDEKWNELVKDINKIIDWKNTTDHKIIALEQDFYNLKDQFDKLHQAVIGKIGEYDKHILNVGAEIQAMEKVFSKVLPVFTENVHELSRITSAVRKDRSEERRE